MPSGTGADSGAHTKPLVSVVVIFLNAQRFIREAIESILQQSYDHWELILVDDGSTDESTHIALSYAAQMPQKVRYVEHAGHRNRGMSASRNLGVSRARGEFLATLDADDIWLPSKLEEQVNIMLCWPDVKLVFGRTVAWQTWSENQKRIRRDFLCPFDLQPDRIYEAPELLVRVLRKKTHPPSMSNILFRREAFDQAGGFVDSFSGLFEDRVFMTKVLLKEKVFFSGKTWDRYRIHSDSCVSRAIAEGLWDKKRLEYLTWAEGLLRQSDCRDRRIYQALRHALWICQNPTLLRFSKLVDRGKLKARLFLRPGETLLLEAGGIRIRNPFGPGKHRSHRVT